MGDFEEGVCSEREDVRTGKGPFINYVTILGGRGGRTVRHVPIPNAWEG